LLHNGVRPWNILAVTFTNKAAKEMRSRVEHMVGPDARDIVVSTFHSACVRFLRRDATLLGFEPSFLIYDDDDQLRLLKAILQDLKIDIKAHPPRKYRNLVDKLKNQLTTPESDENRHLAMQAMKFPQVFEAYAARLKAANAMDFNDLINHMVRILQEHPATLARYHDRYRYLLVDEYQDTNRAQYQLIKLLSEGSRNLMVVGDDDQSIYSFRGAEVRNILEFEKDFPEVEIVRLEQNYRSTGNILRVANALVSHNENRHVKSLWTGAEAGHLIRLIRGTDENDEADRIITEIGRLIRGGRKPGEFAVIYRTNASSRPLEQSLARRRLPYIVIGGRRFFERREVRDALAWLRLMLNPTDDMALLRIINVPTRGIVAKSVGLLRQRARDEGVPLLEAARRTADGSGRAAKAIAGFISIADHLQQSVIHQAPAAAMQEILEETGYLQMLRAEETDESHGRLENLEALLRMTAEMDLEILKESPELSHIDRLRRFMDEACLSSEADNLPDDDGRVTLLTGHLAKGLEFPIVFVAGLCDGVFPHARSLDNHKDIEEERRLAYVAFTRAMERLYLCRSQRRFIRGAGGGGWGDAAPSRFLLELPEDALTGDLVCAPRFGAYGHSRLGSDGGSTARRRTRDAATEEPGMNDKMQAFLARVRADDPQPAPTERPLEETTLAPDCDDVFQTGSRVKHPVFGVGVIRDRDSDGPGAKVLIHFQRFGPRKLRLADARLELLVD
jgi:DNA helicase-2/ATP-dependent DNA helicase PcrA